MYATLCTLFAAATLAASPDPITGTWTGNIATPGGPLEVVVHVTSTGDAAWIGSVDTPAQQSFGIPLSNIEFDGHTLKAECELTQATWTASLGDDGDVLTGQWAQRGLDMPLTCRRGPSFPAVPESLMTALEGNWEGALDVGAIQLRIVMSLHQASPTAMRGTMVSPDQSPDAIPIGRVEWATDRTVRILIGAIGAVYDATLAESGEALAGTFTQGGMPLPLTLKRVEQVATVKRPQEPKPPLPYEEVEVSFPNPLAGITLAGTLTTPPGSGPFPTAVLISGSGLQDRNEEIFQHKPFWILADHLARRGVATLRVDDRGIGGSSTTDTPEADTTYDFATDVEAAVAFLADHPKVASDALGLIGHSEGGIIAPLVASESSDVDFIILLSGTGVRGDALLVAQDAAINRASGLDESEVAAKSALNRALFDVLLDASLDAETTEPRLRTLIQADPEFAAATKEEQEAGLQTALDQLTLPWITTFVRHDPSASLEAVTCPVLALNGELDLQVPYEQNLPAIAEALRRGGNPDATIRVLPGLNHLFQHCDTGLPAEYGRIEETFAPEAMDIIAGWIVDRFAAK